MLTKYASVDVIGTPMIATYQDRRLVKNAHRASFEYSPRPGYLYVRSRMISSRCNDNYDEFPADEIEKGWHTFIGKPVFVNHHNADHRKNRGVIIDAVLHKDANPDGSPDTWVEGLMEVDALSYPKLAKALMEGHIERTSMGVDVDYSICSKCANKASTPLEYCQHIPTMKGIKAATRTASGTVRNEVIREKCYGLRFFENSLLVEDPADPTAYFLGKPEAGPGLEHLSARTASKAGPVSIRCTSCFSDQVFEFRGSSECLDCGETRSPHAHTATSLPHNPHAAANFAKLSRLEATRPQKPLVPHKPVGDMVKGSDELKEWNGKVRVHAKEWAKRNPINHKNIVDHWDAGTDDEHAAGMTWYNDAHHTAKHIANDTGHHISTVANLISNYSPQTHWATNITSAAKVARTRQPIGGPDNKDGIPDVHPETGKVTPKGILASGNQKKAAQRFLDGEHRDDVFSGPKTHAFAHLIEHGGDSPEDQKAGKQRVVVDRHALSVASGARASDAAYSHSGLANKGDYKRAEDAYIKAAKVISKKVGYTVHPHQVQAATWLTRQRLNEQGDREAMSEGSSSASNAQHAIRKMQQYMGEHHPEASLQVPGTGYSHRGANSMEKMDEGLTPAADTSHGSQHRQVQGSRHPFVASSRLGYGEVKAPPDVDTLRDEECPICGETDAYDGTECKVCGYVEPPQQFQDPNVDLAKQLDLRKDNADPAQMDGQDVGHLEDALADPDRDGLNDETGQPIDPNDPTGGNGPVLECPACATQFEPAAPTSISTDPEPMEDPESPEGMEDPTAPEQPEMGDPTDPEGGPEDGGAEAPKEGDVCPACGKGVLVSSQEAEAIDSEGPPATDEDELGGAESPEPGGDIPGEGSGPTRPGDDEEPDDEEAEPSQEEAPAGSAEEDPDAPPDQSLPTDNDEDAEDPAPEADEAPGKNPFKRKKSAWLGWHS
jgi:hypothetical protein